MTREELIERLAARADVPRHSAQVFLHACFDAVKSQLRSGAAVQLPGLGRWTPRLSEQGRLIDVTYTALVTETTPTEAMHGPASSIDSRHFIPAEALESRSTVLREPVDVTVLVTDVRRALGHLPEEDGDVRPAHTASAAAEQLLHELPLPDETEDDGATAQTDPYALPTEGLPIEEDDDPGEEEDSPGEDEEYFVDAYASVEETAFASFPDEASPVGVDSDGVPPPLESEEDELLLEAEMEAEGYAPAAGGGEAETVEEEDEDPLSDTEVFHRNRDQLYHPPEEPSRRKLLVTAAVLTFCVLVIIVYLLLDEGEPHRIPGSAPVGTVLINGDPHA